MAATADDERTDMITEYHRPQTLDGAIALAGGPNAVILGGGTTVNAGPTDSSSVAVDLQALDLSGIDADGDVVHVGATTRLQDVVDSDEVPTLLRDLARREAPNTIRNAATIGGTIAAAHPESQLLTGLLAYGATVTIARDGSTIEQSIDDLLDDPSLLNGSIITSISLPAGGTAAADRTARTPMDHSIVMAVAYRGGDGDVRLALSGVAPVPLVVEPEELEALDPPADFRGTSEYRRQLASVLAGRVLIAVGGAE
jgi:probable selenate reductase FAD-binding subunit